MRLIVTDLDGTLLDDKGQYNQVQFGRVLTTLEAAGDQLVIASGRSLANLHKIFADFRDRLIFVAENGALICQGDEVLYERPLTADLYHRTLAKMAEHPLLDWERVVVSCRQMAYLLESVKDPVFIKAIDHFCVNVSRLPDFKDLTEPVLKIDSNYPPQELEEALAWFQANLPDLHAAITSSTSIDLMVKGVDKGQALKFLADRFKITAEQIIAFGDNYNDLEMLTYAGFVLVPENAKAAIKALADKIIGHHATGSVLNYIEEEL